MGTTWSRERIARHEAKFPPEQRQERTRIAQANYRERHQEWLRRARLAANILSRHRKPGDIEELAHVLRYCLGETAVRDLCRALTPRKPKPRKRSKASSRQR